MNKQERLFLAIGGADPELVARSEQRRRNHWLRYAPAIAACLLMVLTVFQIKPLWAAPPDVVSPGTPGPGLWNPPEDEEPGGQELILPEGGSEIGTLRLLGASVSEGGGGFSDLCQRRAVFYL